MTKLIVNCETGEVIERDLSKAEKDQQKIDETAELAKQAELHTKEAARQAILDKLGLTADDLKTLLG